MKKNIFICLAILVFLSAALGGCGRDMKNETTDNTKIENSTEIDSNQKGSLPVEEVLKQLPDINELSYSQYMALSPDVQQAIINTFATDKEFADWLFEIKQIEDAFNQVLNQQTTTGTVMEPTEVESTAASESTDGTDGTEYPEPPSTPNADDPKSEGVTFMDYQKMSASEQKKFIASFGSIDAFMQWHADAVQKYKDSMTEWGSTGNTPTDPAIEIPTDEIED